jgi:hypothetical protein
MNDLPALDVAAVEVVYEWFRLNPHDNSAAQAVFAVISSALRKQLQPQPL